MLACVAISASFIISNSYILCLLISSDGLAALSCLSFFFSWGGGWNIAFFLCFNRRSSHAPLHSSWLLFLSAQRMSFGWGELGVHVKVKAWPGLPAAQERPPPRRAANTDLSRAAGRLSAPGRSERLSLHCIAAFWSFSSFWTWISVPTPPSHAASTFPLKKNPRSTALPMARQHFCGVSQ